ncbi:hypothetical protein [Mesonia aestuariivivens]|uniref:Uncharacterized protein n=1 Tax=Mesonia aestuariivivens TaxID=2796128 RepID=A0ABS6W4A8_9FLAO|nr:hypothetical protein [Mesonia aestuariivivens]MBW2962321.1 hypothetical protein [Mesonia aestuariivivens]
MKKLFAICVMLIAFNSYSQDTIQITIEQAKDAIVAKQQNRTLNKKLMMLESGYANLEDHLRLMQEALENEQMKFNLLQENYNILNTQYEAEKAIKPKSKWWEFVLLGLGAFGLGFTVGSL